MRYAFALLVCPVIARAAVSYDLGVQPIDQSNLAPASAAAPASRVTRCFVENGKVRLHDADAKTTLLLEEGAVYVIDEAARVVRVFKHATLRQVSAHYADIVRQAELSADNAPPEDRAAAQRRAADLREESERLLRPVPRDYSMSASFGAVDGHACRLWEERERGEKRLEICVAPVAAVPGGADILNGMKTLSEFRQGSMWALGVDLGVSDWWPDVAHLGGVPLSIREFKYGALIGETTLTSIHPAAAAESWDLPEGYRLEDSSDSTAW